jgi:hypothetical protein
MAARIAATTPAIRRRNTTDEHERDGCKNDSTHANP